MVLTAPAPWCRSCHNPCSIALTSLRSPAGRIPRRYWSAARVDRTAVYPSTQAQRERRSSWRREPRGRSSAQGASGMPGALIVTALSPGEIMWKRQCSLTWATGHPVIGGPRGSSCKAPDLPEPSRRIRYHGGNGCAMVPGELAPEAHGVSRLSTGRECVCAPSSSPGTTPSPRPGAHLRPRSAGTRDGRDLLLPGGEHGEASGQRLRDLGSREPPRARERRTRPDVPPAAARSAPLLEPRPRPARQRAPPGGVRPCGLLPDPRCLLRAGGGGAAEDLGADRQPGPLQSPGRKGRLDTGHVAPRPPVGGRRGPGAVPPRPLRRDLGRLPGGRPLPAGRAGRELAPPRCPPGVLASRGPSPRSSGPPSLPAAAGALPGEPGLPTQPGRRAVRGLRGPPRARAPVVRVRDAPAGGLGRRGRMAGSPGGSSGPQVPRVRPRPRVPRRGGRPKPQPRAVRVRRQEQGAGELEARPPRGQQPRGGRRVQAGASPADRRRPGGARGRGARPPVGGGRLLGGGRRRPRAVPGGVMGEGGPRGPGGRVRSVAPGRLRVLILVT